MNTNLNAEPGGWEIPEVFADERTTLRNKQAPGCYTLPVEYMQKTMNFKGNVFLNWLATLPGWDSERAHAAATRYNVGTGRNAHDGWAIFWQFDEKLRVRSGKLMKYQTNGKRARTTYATNWVHTLLERAGKLPDNYELQQCLFGAHLLTPDEDRPVAIVESEKTAIIASEYMPGFLWLACGGIGNMKDEKLRLLAGRNVVLFPDKGAYNEWKIHAVAHNFHISDLLENSEAEHKSDIADYLIKYNLDAVTGAKKAPEYPPEWDSIPVPERDSAEYKEMLRHEAQAAAELENLPLSVLRRKDPRIDTIINEFHAIPC